MPKPLAIAAALRASASTGFRAPTPGQQNAFKVTTQYDHALMDLVNNGTIPSTSRVARLRGSEPLKPERSVNFTAGAVVDAGAFSPTTSRPSRGPRPRRELGARRLGGRTTFGLLFNRTATAVARFDPPVLDDSRSRQLQEAVPGTR